MSKTNKMPPAHSSQNRRQSRTTSNGRKPSYVQPRSPEPVEPLLGSRTKQDILGVALIVVALILFISLLFNPAGAVTQALSQGLSNLLGIGAVVLPVLILAFGITLLLRNTSGRFSARIALGMLIFYLAFLLLASTVIPGAEADPSSVFWQSNLVAHGGLVGGGMAWVLLSAIGFAGTLLVGIGLLIIAILVIGPNPTNVMQNATSLVNRVKGDHSFSQNDSDDCQMDEPAPASYRPGRSGSTAPRPVPTIKLPDNPNAESPTIQMAGPDSELVEPTNNEQDSKNKAATQLTRKLPNRKIPESNVENETADDTALDAMPATVPFVTSKTENHDSERPERNDGFTLPDMALLNTSKPTRQSRKAAEALQDTAYLLQETLSDFGIAATVVDWVAGPTVTLFKVDLPAGVRVSRITALTDDIALALASPGVRIFAPVPGTNYVGIEVPNAEHQTVFLGDCLKEAGEGPLQVAIGKDVEGHVIVSDLAKMPHLLIGGTTGSGKSVAINGMIMSILMRTTPSEVRLILIDPKRVEFTPYNGIPNLYVPVVTECKEAAAALSWAVAEMERRLKEFSKMGVRNISQYNTKIRKNNLQCEEADKLEEAPYIVVIIDELADLMMNVGKEIEFSISRLAQLARAAGIHLIVATQRPSANVVTGLIKANITNRMALNVATGIDSRVILDQTGAENLIGNGDLLLSKPEWAKPQRIQGCFVSESEIEAVVAQLKGQGEPDYHNDILQTNVIMMGDTNPDGSGGISGPDDPLLWDAAEIVCSTGLGSTSNLQRRLSVGYARAGRIMDNLEEKGIVGPPNGSRPREVLIDSLELESLKALEHVTNY